MKEDEVEIELYLDKETAETLRKMTKPELLNRLCAVILRSRVQEEDQKRLENEVSTLERKLDKAESYIEQGRAMIEAIMEKWYSYEE